jgi:hypothetical protein
MKPVDALIELLDRVDANHGAAVLVNDDELRQWPSEAVKAMKSQKLVTKASVGSAICLGCEHECVMPVHTARRGKGAGCRSSFATNAATPIGAVSVG